MDNNILGCYFGFFGKTQNIGGGSRLYGRGGTGGEQRVGELGRRGGGQSHG